MTGIDHLIEKALQNSADMNVIGQLIELKMKEERAEKENAANIARSEFQAECPIIKKTKKVMHKGSLRYSYAPLESVVEQVGDLLKKHGFSYTIDSRPLKETDEIEAIVRVHHNGGATWESRFINPIDREAYMNDSQKAASALTFAKRYAFLDAFGILTADEDDDAIATGERESAADLYRKFTNITSSVLANYEFILAMKDAIDVKDYNHAAELVFETHPDPMATEPLPSDDPYQLLWTPTTKGGPFSVDERKAMKEKIYPIFSAMVMDERKKQEKKK